VAERITLERLVYGIQHFTKHWPEQLRAYPDLAAQASMDSDGGFERLIRCHVESHCPAGDVSRPRETCFSDSRTGLIIPHHEIDLIVTTTDCRFVVEAKAWSRGEVGKDDVIIFLYKILDFLVSAAFEAEAEVIRCGFIGRSGFTEAALRLLFAAGIIPFSNRSDCVSFHHLDALLERAAIDCRGWGITDEAVALEQSRADMTPFLALERRPLTGLIVFDSDSVLVDMQSVRLAAASFDESRAVHRRALESYRRFRELDLHRRG
jgi:hypothetical protein